jgi:tRNA threonylcarbamoyladenosine biosynthesis protein TsaB
MTRILNIDTSTEVCSVCVSENGEVLSIRENSEGKNHASLLTLFIDDVLKESETPPGRLSAVSVSKGPGSYTGLRIGVSAAKGIAYALNIPVLAPGTLDSMTAGYLKGNHPEENHLLVPMIDARRMEVYSAVYNSAGNPLREVKAEIIETASFNRYLPEHTLILFGNGAEKCREVLDAKNFRIDENFTHSSSHMSMLSDTLFKEKKFEDVAYFEPFYLKDFIATTPRNKVF